MTLEEYVKQLGKIQNTWAAFSFQQLSEQYWRIKRPIKGEAIVSDNQRTIKVDMMFLDLVPVPCLSLYGSELGKNGEAKKKQPLDNQPMFQFDVKSINGNTYNYLSEIDDFAWIKQ